MVTNFPSEVAIFDWINHLMLRNSIHQEWNQSQNFLAITGNLNSFDGKIFLNCFLFNLSSKWNRSSFFQLIIISPLGFLKLFLKFLKLSLHWTQILWELYRANFSFKLLKNPTKPFDFFYDQHYLCVWTTGIMFLQ